MKLVNFDFLRGVGLEKQYFHVPFRFRTQRDLRKIQEDLLSRRKKKKRVAKVFVSRGGIRL